MKLGIITFHNAKNYGAYFQTYALTQVLGKLKSKNTDIEVIDYQCKFIDDDYKPIIDFSSLKRFIVSALSFFPIVIRNLKFNKALKTTVKLSKSYNINTINDADVYDCYIAGSDMIWHWHTVKGEEKFDETYFLSFVKDANKKNSYAASFGTDLIPNKYRKLYFSNLASFNNISVREKSGQFFLQDLNRNINLNLDPTLLVDNNIWDSLIKNKKKKENYILVYEVGVLTNRMINYAKMLSNKTGYKVVYLNSEYNFRNKLKLHNYRFGFSPSDFISYFKFADYIITNSYHGTVFSILYEKKFESEIDSWIKNNRSLELMELLGLEDRILNDNSDIDKEIDWNSVKQRLSVEQNKAYWYLKKVMGKSDE